MLPHDFAPIKYFLKTSHYPSSRINIGRHTINPVANLETYFQSSESEGENALASTLAHITH